MNKISFGAQININKDLIYKKMKSDKFFDQRKKENLYKTLDIVDAFSQLPEQSVITIQPKLNSNQLNFVTKVENDTKSICTTIDESSARKISSDTDFAKRYIKHIKEAILNVEQTQKDTIKIKDFIEQSNSLKDINFVKNIAKYIIECLKTGYNPTKMILFILQNLDNNNPNNLKELSIESQKTRKNTNCTIKHYTQFVLTTYSENEKVQIKTPLKIFRNKLIF